MASRPDQRGTLARQHPAVQISGQQPQALLHPDMQLFTPPMSPADILLHHNMLRHSAVDLLVLTFNCAKTVIDVDVFARHLRSALVQHGQDQNGGGHAQAAGAAAAAEELPDLVVFSLQEISPLTQGYLGGQFLNPYLNPFKEALNIAALDVEQQQQQSGGSSSSNNGGGARPIRRLQRTKTAISGMFRRQPDYPYKLVEARNVGMTAIMVFARKPDAIHHIKHAECAFGIANMGNKGAIALRVTYADAGTTDSDDGGSDVNGDTDSAVERRTAEITFVATHLAAMEYNLRRRNANWASICSSCLFEDPKQLLPQEFHLDDRPGAKNLVAASTGSSSAKQGKQTDGGVDISPPTEEERRLLEERDLHVQLLPSEHSSQLHNASIFKPGTHLFVAGDLNYRISTTTPSTPATFPTLQTYSEFFERDQLTNEKQERRTLHGMTEPPVTFPPTYKIKHLSREKASEAINAEEYKQAVEAGRADEVVPWKWASHRWPGWCDRILFLDIPSWVKRRYEGDGSGPSKQQTRAPEIKILAYNSLPTMQSSDHQPVFLRALVPLLTPEELAPPEDTDELTSEDKLDPRVQLPVPVDMGAFERRAAARRKEVITGMTTLFFSTKEGALVLVTVSIVGLWTWWLYQGFF